MSRAGYLILKEMNARRAFFFFQAEDGIRDFCLSRGLEDVYKGQLHLSILRQEMWRPHLVFSILIEAFSSPSVGFWGGSAWRGGFGQYPETDLSKSATPPKNQGSARGLLGCILEGIRITPLLDHVAVGV